MGKLLLVAMIFSTGFFTGVPACAEDGGKWSPLDRIEGIIYSEDKQDTDALALEEEILSELKKIDYETEEGWFHLFLWLNSMFYPLGQASLDFFAELGKKYDISDFARVKDFIATRLRIVGMLEGYEPACEIEKRILEIVATKSVMSLLRGMETLESFTTWEMDLRRRYPLIYGIYPEYAYMRNFEFKTADGNTIYAIAYGYEENSIDFFQISTSNPDKDTADSFVFNYRLKMCLLPR